MTARVSSWMVPLLSVIGAASLMRSAKKVSAQLRRWSVPLLIVIDEVAVRRPASCRESLAMMSVGPV